MTTTLDWYGCATFGMRTAGLTLFLDAYIDRAANARGTGLRADDIDTLHPDVAILAAAGRGNIDGEPIQGLLAEFVARQAERIRPQRLVLCHHDDWLPGCSVDTDVAPIRAELAGIEPSPELLELAYLDGTPILPLP